MRTSESIVKITKALLAVQGSMQAAKKDKTNPFHKSKYADLAAVWDVCREPLNKNDLAIVQGFEPCDGGVLLVTRVLHTSGEWISSELKMPAIKNDPQGIGSAITYARRYALSAMLGIVAEDDDGEGAMGHIPPAVSISNVPPTASLPSPAAIPPAVTAQIWQDYLELCGGQQEHALNAIMKITNGRSSANLTPADVFALQGDIQARRSAAKAPDVGSLREDAAFIAAEQAIQNTQGATQEAAQGF